MVLHSAFSQQDWMFGMRHVVVIVATLDKVETVQVHTAQSTGVNATLLPRSQQLMGSI